MTYTTITMTPDVNNSQVAILTLNRPEAMNSFNVDMCYEMIAAVEAADADPNIRVIVVTGAGRAFCAGADISQGFDAVAPSEVDEATGIGRDLGGVLNLALFDCDTPILAAINGAAVGIGATMTIPMDIRIASEKSKFAFPFARRGIVFDGAASWFLPRLVGFAKANEWILKADIIMADEMQRAGFVSEVLAPKNVLPRALDLARDIAVNCSPTSTAINKRLLRDSMFGSGAMDGAAYQMHLKESELLTKAFASYDCHEGVTAFFEKRPPKFKNREG
ncbi:enoyl-CoA hydratase-related protein [Litorimonas sp. RW-G-Af-16]|uniref:enoyl-CoA hydratase-related protein n=1 Tax=Litorimonas sp. RW-G-Af-16 TaxID=3241168 RepID=UPI00390C5C58